MSVASAEGSAAPPATITDMPAEAATFSARTAASLTAAGGLLAAVGAIGTWIRATRVVVEGSPPEQVAAIGGAAEGAGWVLAAFGIAAAVASLAWFARRRLARAPIAALGLLLIGLIAGRLAAINARAAEMVRAEPPDPSFFSFHAGFGWGAWMLLVAAVVLTLGLAIGGLRELDLWLGERR